ARPLPGNGGPVGDRSARWERPAAESDQADLIRFNHGGHGGHGEEMQRKRTDSVPVPRNKRRVRRVRRGQFLIRYALWRNAESDHGVSSHWTPSGISTNFSHRPPPSL